MDGMKRGDTLTILLPKHTAKKLRKLSKYYRIPVDMLMQRLVVDRVDDLMEAVILEPARKERG